MKRKPIQIILIFIFISTFVYGCKWTRPASNEKNKSSAPQTTNTTNNKSQNDSDAISLNSGNMDIATESQPSSQANDYLILKQGDKGDQVVELQEKLYCIGYDISVDGIFGSSTVSYLTDFQKKYNLTLTGSLTLETKNKLYSLSVVRKMPQSPNNSDSSKTASNPASTPAISSLTKIPDIVTSPGDSQQVIVVLASSYKNYQVSIKAYNKSGDSWVLFNSCGGVIGKGGFNDNKFEGDLTTPTGKYSFPFIFGQVSNPGFHLPYRIAGVNDYWVSNKFLEEYNIWMHYDGTDANERLYSYESLWKVPLYKYAAVISYNYGPGKILGKGSAIFLHISPSNGGGTLGCIAMSESNLLKTLKWMDPNKKPIIIMGVKGKI